MKLTTKRLRQIIKEELNSVLFESSEMDKMVSLISNEDINDVKQGLLQIMELADLMGFRVLDLIDQPGVNYKLKKLKEIFGHIMHLKEKYYPGGEITMPLNFSKDQKKEFGLVAKKIILIIMLDLSRELGIGEELVLITNDELATDIYQWTRSFSADILYAMVSRRDLLRPEGLSMHMKYGNPASGESDVPRKIRPDEDPFKTAFEYTGKWIQKIVPLMTKDPILGHFLEEYQ